MTVNESLNVIPGTTWAPMSAEAAAALARQLDGSAELGLSGEPLEFTPATLARFVNAAVAQLAQRHSESVRHATGLLHEAMELSKALGHAYVTVEHMLAEWAEAQGLDDLRRDATSFVCEHVPSASDAAQAPESTAGVQRVLRRLLASESFPAAVYREGEDSWARQMLSKHGLPQFPSRLSAKSGKRQTSTPSANTNGSLPG